MRHRKVAVLIALGILAVPRAVHAEPEPLRFLTPARCVTEGGSTVDLAPGRYLPEPAWSELDASVRALQDDTTRLQAENDSLRKSAVPSRSTFVLVGLAFAAGISVGVWASR